MIQKNNYGASQYFCDHCHEVIVGVIWATPNEHFCTERCRKAGAVSFEKGEIDMARKPKASKATSSRKPAAVTTDAKPRKRRGFTTPEADPLEAAADNIEVTAEDMEAFGKEEAPAAKATAKASTDGKPKPKGGAVKMPPETPIPASLPKRSPFEDEHQTKMYQLMRKCKTTGEFKEQLKAKKLFRDIRDAHFANTLYAMVRAGNAAEA